MSGKVREKSGNLIMTGEWQPCEKLCWMNRKWINEKDFVTDIVFRNTITVCQSLLWLLEEKPQLVLCFTVHRKVVSVNR